VERLGGAGKKYGAAKRRARASSSLNCTVYILSRKSFRWVCPRHSAAFMLENTVRLVLQPLLIHDKDFWYLPRSLIRISTPINRRSNASRHRNHNGKLVTRAELSNIGKASTAHSGNIES